MSLQVWLPLNGNLNNQGLSDTTITHNGVTENANGKIGKCYLFDGKSITINSIFTTNPTEISVCAWMKLSSEYVANNGLHLVTINSNEFRICLSKDNAAVQVIYKYSNGGGTKPSTARASDLVANVWYHVAVVIKVGDSINIYINGQLDKTYSISNIVNPPNIANQNIILGTSGTELGKGCMNDFRIYDHALSVKEIEEISKGLVLHYKLDDTYIENSSFLSSLISTTAYNASLGKYGYNANSNLGKVDGFFQGRQCTKVYTLTANQTAQPYSYFSNLFTSDGTNAPAYKTLSFDYYTTVPTTTWLNIYKLGSGTGTATWKVFNSAGIKTGTYTNSSNSIAIVPNEWNHIEITLHGTTSANAEWGYCINGPAHTSNADYYFLYANIQLEEKDHATGYGSNMHSNIIYDSSGYEHNGEIINNISIESNSPRYNSCIHMSATNQKIKISNFLTAGFGNSYTFAWWEKISSASPMHWGFADGIRLNGMYTGRLWNTGDGSNNPLYTPGTTTQVTAPSTGVWHHWAMIGDGTTCKVYQDGVLWGQAKTYKAISGSTIYINGWDSGTSYCSDNASMSDFRIYCTALTAEQVKELYDTSATIDKNGNVYAREVIE